MDEAKPPPKDFDEWVAYHAELFGLTEKEEPTVLAWKKVFRDTAIADLVEASDYLAGHPEALTANDARFLGKMNLHLAALRQRITEQRAITYTTKRDDIDRTRGTCDDCGGSGFVTVPHIRSVQDGEWRPMLVARGGPMFYTQAVQCHCPKGNLMHNAADPERKPMRLEAYQQRNPLWKVQLEKRRREANAVAAATAKPGDEDVLNRFADSLKERMDQALAPFEATLPFPEPELEDQHSLATWQRRREQRNED